MTQPDRFSDIVEVTKTNTFGANYLMRMGYRLLGFATETGSGKHPKGENFYVRRSIQYLLGRTADVERADIPPRQQNQVSGEIATE